MQPFKLPNIHNPQPGDIFYTSPGTIAKNILPFNLPQIWIYSHSDLDHYVLFRIVDFMTKLKYPYYFYSDKTQIFHPIAHSQVCADWVSTLKTYSPRLAPNTQSFVTDEKPSAIQNPSSASIVYPGARFSLGDVVALKDKSVKFVVTGIGLYKLFVVDYDDATQPSVEMTLNISPDLEIVQP